MRDTFLRQQSCRESVVHFFFAGPTHKVVSSEIAAVRITRMEDSEGGDTGDSEDSAESGETSEEDAKDDSENSGASDHDEQSGESEISKRSDIPRDEGMVAFPRIQSSRK